MISKLSATLLMVSFVSFVSSTSNRYETRVTSHQRPPTGHEFSSQQISADCEDSADSFEDSHFESQNSSFDKTMSDVSDIWDSLMSLSSKLDQLLPIIKRFVDEQATHDEYSGQNIRDMLNEGLQGFMNHEISSQYRAMIPSVKNHKSKQDLQGSSVKIGLKEMNITSKDHQAQKFSEQIDYGHPIPSDDPTILSKNRDAAEMDKQQFNDYRVPITMFSSDLDRQHQVSMSDHKLGNAVLLEFRRNQSSLVTNSIDSNINPAPILTQVKSGLDKSNLKMVIPPEPVNTDFFSSFGDNETPREILTTIKPNLFLNIWKESVKVNRDYKSVSDKKGPTYLGLGQLHKVEPFNGNNRRQARISCQFGDLPQGNMTISDVDWAKFSGSYNLNDARPPPFDCQEEECIMTPIKTDTTTTVHPRPAIQNYINVMPPSYSITLHRVQPKDLGTYRCSAIRTLDGIPEIVYRIIPMI